MSDILLGRRRALMNVEKYTPDGYIKSGLVFFLDGLSIGADEWVDKIYNIRMAVYNSSYSPTFLANGVQFNNNAKCKLKSVQSGFGSKYVWRKDTHTIEVCINGSTGYSIVDYGGEVMSSFWNNEYIWAPRTALNYDISGGIVGKKTISVNQSRCICNRVSYTTRVEDYWDRHYDGYLYIGGRPLEIYPYGGIIHSIRVYNRQLSAEEMINNQEVDNTRFNLGLW